MFIHNKTKKVYYSIDEKIEHYSLISKGKKSHGNVTKTYARKRLRELKELKARDFESPDLVVVNDKHFGNGISKPRLGVVVATKDSKVKVAPFHHRKTKVLILDNYTDYQLDQRATFVDRSDLYETKYMDPVPPLTDGDKRK